MNKPLRLSSNSHYFLFLFCVLSFSVSFASEICSWDNQLSDNGGSKEFFPSISKIKYEGVESKNPLSFRYYNAEEVILGKAMKDWFRFSVAFWHTFRGDGSDVFGSPTKFWPWEETNCKCQKFEHEENEMNMAYARMQVNFEFLSKLGVDFWCFHDRDIAPEGKNLAKTNANLDKVVDFALKLQSNTSIVPLWGTAQLFKHPRYMHGAATSPDAHVFAFAAAQVKKAIEVTKRLGGKNFVFWGGREGYQSLLNTNLDMELDHMALFLKMAVDWKKKLGFEGNLLLEPKPQEPTKHQYDWDSATTIGFLNHYNLSDEFKLNIECNHATLSGHSCFHELEFSRARKMLGNIDANTGDPQTGWDTDQFLVDPAECTLFMLSVVRNGGLFPGGINFDAKLRRESTDLDDLFISHISSMDCLARGLRNVKKMMDEGFLDNFLKKRYSSYSLGIGQKIHNGEIGFEELESFALDQKEPKLASAKQELVENYFYNQV